MTITEHIVGVTARTGNLLLLSIWILVFSGLRPLVNQPAQPLPVDHLRVFILRRHRLPVEVLRNSTQILSVSPPMMWCLPLRGFPAAVWSEAKRDRNQARLV